MRIALRKIFCPQYLYRLHKQAVLNSLDAFVQGFFRVSWLNSDLFAADDGAGINFRGYVVDRGKGMLERSLQAVGVGIVAQHKSNLNARKFFAFDSVDESLQIAAAAR